MAFFHRQTQRLLFSFGLYGFFGSFSLIGFAGLTASQVYEHYQVELA